jgi:molybdate transport system substrate-binding protein
MGRAGFLAIGGCVLAGLAALAWFWPAGWPRGTQPVSNEVRVAAAADLKFALDDVIAAFRERHPDITVQVRPGATGNLFAMLANRGPFDLFLAADIEYPRKLIEQGLADHNREFHYGVGHLVVWLPKSSPLEVEKTGIKTLLDPRVRKIAIANEQHAPYGRAAVAALKSLGVYEQVEHKLVRGENVAQAAQFVQSGSADIGVIPLSLALAPVMRDQGRYQEVPRDAYPRLLQGGVILSWAQDRQAAERFRDFLLGPEGQAILKRYGFAPPEE